MTIELSTTCRLLWAKSKPYHPLWCHLLDIAAVCRALLPRFGGIASLPDAWTLYLVALHDIGKADGYFQAKDECGDPVRATGLPMPRYDDTKGFRHEARSADWLLDHLKALGWKRKAANVVCDAIRGHHADFGAEARIERPDDEQAWNPIRAELAAMLKNILAPPPLALEMTVDASAEGIKLSGLIVLSDWIASNHDLYAYDDPTLLDTNASASKYFEAATVLAQTVVDRLGLLPALVPSSSGAFPFVAVWPECIDPRPSQAALEAACARGVSPGLAIIEAPMGEGKTEGAIYLSEYWGRKTGRTGAYIALPTQATSNQMHDRYEKFLGVRRSNQAKPRLVHGMAWLMDDDASSTPPETEDAQERALAQDWFRNAKRALIAPEGVGTIDQVLMAALNVKHGFLRLLGLTQKVLIVDEVHAYDDYMTTLLCRLLAWCRALDVPVILLSATLSHRQKEALTAAYAGCEVLPPLLPLEEEPYPLLTFVGRDGTHEAIAVTPGESRSLRLRLHPGVLRDPEGAARLAAEETKHGGCACVIVNTVRDAQAIFRILRTMDLPDTTLLAFHARFRAERRGEIENEVKRLFGKPGQTDPTTCRPRRAILVATQVVEQSLDVDFDVMLTQVAPIDLLLQRSGRLWRHERGERPTGSGPILHVLMPETGTLDFGSTSKGEHDRGIYATEQLLRTVALLEARTEITLPKDFRVLIESCYGDTPLPSHRIPDADLEKAATWRLNDQDHARQEAITHLVPPPNPASFDYAARSGKPVEEREEGDRASYFHARTRLGDETANAVVLHDSRLVAVAKSADWPGMRLAKRILLQKVGVAVWWLTNLTPEEGYDPIEKIREGWLRRHHVIPMRDGVWRGWRSDDDGKRRKRVTISDDHDIGLELIEEKEQS